MCAAMRLVASRSAPALLSTPAKRHVKQEIRHEAMSLVLAGIVATMVLATLKVSKLSFYFLLPLAHYPSNKPLLYRVSVHSFHHLLDMRLFPRGRYLSSSLYDD